MHCHVFTVTIATAGEQYAAYQHDSTVFGAGSPWWTTSGGPKGCNVHALKAGPTFCGWGSHCTEAGAGMRPQMS